MSNSRRAFYRLYIYSYELALHLQLPLPNIVKIDHYSKNPTKKLAISLQWYMLITEELLDSIFETELDSSLGSVSKIAKTTSKIYPRDHFNHFTIRETLCEARKVIQNVLSDSTAIKSYILDDFESFFTQLSECSQCPCQFDLDTSNSEILRWVDDYKESCNRQRNTLNLRNYSKRLHEFDNLLNLFFNTSYNEIKDYPNDGTAFLVISLLFLVIPMGEYLSYADCIKSLCSSDKKISPEVSSSLLSYYVVLNPNYLKKIEDQPRYDEIRYFSKKVAKSFGLYQIARLFPKSTLIYDSLFDRLTVAQWLLHPIPKTDDLKEIYDVLQSKRNRVVFHEASENKLFLESEQDFHNNIFMRLLQSILQKGVGALKLHRANSEIQQFIIIALKNLWCIEWVDLKERSDVKLLIKKIDDTTREMNCCHSIWKKLIRPEGLLEQTSKAWHQRHELSSGYCVLDMNENSEKHQQFTSNWQHVIKETLIDSEVLLLLIEYFERTTAERHSPNDLQLHGMIASQYSPSEPATFATVPSMSTNYITDVWKAVVHSIKQAEQKDLYHEFTLVLSALEETNLDDLLP